MLGDPKVPIIYYLYLCTNGEPYKPIFVPKRQPSGGGSGEALFSCLLPATLMSMSHVHLVCFKTWPSVTGTTASSPSQNSSCCCSCCCFPFRFSRPLIPTFSFSETSRTLTTKYFCCVLCRYIHFPRFCISIAFDFNHNAIRSPRLVHTILPSIPRTSVSPRSISDLRRPRY